MSHDLLVQMAYNSHNNALTMSKIKTHKTGLSESFEVDG